MTEIPDEAIVAAARCAWVTINSLTEEQWDNPGPRADLKQQILDEYAETLTAAAPIIRADERRKITGEIRALSTGDPAKLEDCQRHEPDVCNRCYGREEAAQLIHPRRYGDEDVERVAVEMHDASGTWCSWANANMPIRHKFRHYARTALNALEGK